MTTLLSEEEMYAMDSGDDSDHDIISTEMLEDIRDVSQSHPNVNLRESRYKICDYIRQRQSERKGVLRKTRSMGKGFTQGIQYDSKIYFAGIDSFGRIWFRSFPFHSIT